MAYTGNSIVDYLGSTGAASDYASRAALAKSKGINAYTGTADQNTQLLNMLRGAGTPAPTPAVPTLSPTPSPYIPQPTGNQSSTPAYVASKPPAPTNASPTPTPLNFGPSSGSSMIPPINTATQTSTPSTNYSTPATPSVATPTGNSNAFSASTLTRNLAPGTQGDDVKQLQQWLIGQGYNIAAGATGYYGDQTKAAVAAWQQKNGMQVDPSEAGYFGPKSRAQIGSVTPPPSTGGGTPVIPQDNGSGSYGSGATGTPGGSDFGGNNGQPLQLNSPLPPDTASANVTDNELLKNILQAMKPSAAEIDLQTKMANAEASRKLSYQDIEGNPIATPFMTGQEAAVDKTVNNTEQTITGKLNIEQSKRQAAIDANKTALDYSLQKQNIQKPFSVSLGAAVYDPKTGNTSGGLYDGDNGKIISQAIQEGRLTPDMITRYGAQAILTTLQSNPGYNFVTGQAGANFTKNADTQKFIANSNTVINTINDPTNGIKALSNQVNRGGITVTNNGVLALKAGVSDKATAVFVQQANILADEISKILGGSSGTDFTIKLGQELVNPNYSQDTFNATMDNLVNRVNNKVKEYQAQGAQGNQTGSTGGGTGSDSIFNF